MLPVREKSNLALLSVVCFSIYYNKLAKKGHEDLRVTSPFAGDYCCARFSHDKVWYRVRILEVLDKLKGE